MNESKALYIGIAFMQQCVSLVWVQALYNDPSIWKSRSTEEWVIIGIISGANVLTGTLVTWKAAISSSSNKNGKPHETNPPNGNSVAAGNPPV